MLNPYDHRDHPVAPAPQAKNASKKPDFKTYQSPGNELGRRGLVLALWYEKNKLTLFKILFGLLVLVNIFLWFFSLVKWGDYLIFGIDEVKRLAGQAVQTINYDSFKPRFAARPLEVLTVGILPGGVNKYDAVAEVANPNERFAAEFDYSFALGDSERTSKQRTFLLPGETRPLAFLGITGPLSVSPAIILENLSWQRISAHYIKDIDEWQEYRLDFAVSDFNFQKARAAAESAHADVITFKLKNSSPFGYKIPEFLVGLYNSQGLAGVQRLQLDDFQSEEVKNIDLRSFAPDLTVSNVTAYPIINIYRSSAYLPPEK